MTTESAATVMLPPVLSWASDGPGWPGSGLPLPCPGRPKFDTPMRNCPAWMVTAVLSPNTSWVLSAWPPMLTTAPSRLTWLAAPVSAARSMASVPLATNATGPATGSRTSPESLKSPVAFRRSWLAAEASI